MSHHEFGVMEEIMYNVRYDTYEPKKYKCISVDDEIIEEVLHNYEEKFKKMKAYIHTTSLPGYGLNYTGITLVPPESLWKFRDIIVDANRYYRSEELELLIKTIDVAIKREKFIIHFGI